MVPPDCYSHHALLKLQAVLEEAEEKDQLLMHNHTTGGEGEGDLARGKQVPSTLASPSRLHVADASTPLLVQPAPGQLKSTSHALLVTR